MASGHWVKGFFKSFINVPAWMGADSLLRGAADISRMSKELFTLKKPPAREETFAQAAQRFNLNEADLLQRQKAFGRLAAVYLIIAVGLGSYATYLWHKNDYLSVLMTLVLVLVALSFSFKEHFWYIQMRQKRLGLTVKDWFLCAIGRTKAKQVSP